MPDFGIFRGFNEKLFGDKLVAGQLPTQLGLIGSEDFAYLYLLDDYPNSAAAYSLRLLRSAYTGDAIQVRRASDNTTQDIGFVNNELDVTSLESFCSGTNGFVTTWYDQSGNGRDATQSTAASQPQIVSSGSVITENGKPIIFNDRKELRFSSFASSGGVACFVVGKPIDSEAIFVSGGDNVGNRFDFGVRTSSDYRILISEGGTTERIEDSSNYLGTYGLYSATQSDLRLDNSSINTGNMNNSLQAYTTSSALFTRRLGNSANPGESRASEIIVYPSDQTSNVSGIETNINDFYSIY